MTAKHQQSILVQAWYNNRWPLFICAVASLVYAYFFYRSIGDWWFNPIWTTDDSLQQAYPFHKVMHPDLFAGDLITTMMESYLTPIHYGLWWLITYFTQDPIMTGHWVMLIQLLLTVWFVFGAVKYAAGPVPAWFSVAWVLHTRHMMQRLTQGLPRGWAAPLFAAFFFFALRGNHKGVLATILVGCLLHPPATLIIAFGYGLLLLWRVLNRKTRAAHKTAFLQLLLCSPVFFVIAWKVVQMPPEIGTMATYEVAAQMPEFSTPKGRFPFVPLKDVDWEFRTFGFQAFLSRFYSPDPLWKAWMPTLVAGLFTALLLIGYLRKRRVLPAECVCFLFATLTVYFLSRQFAFKLYVPDRHLQFPMAMFFIVTFCVMAWRAGFGPKVATDNYSTSLNHHPADSALHYSFGAFLLTSLVAILVIGGSSNGLQGSANFNYSIDKKGGVFAWLKDNTPLHSVVAGEPTLIDGVMLFGQRQGYVTTEVAHPFYDRYYAEIGRRFGVALRAHYARDLNELVSILKPEGVDYFVFERKRFYPEELQKATYFKPFDELVQQLASRQNSEYAFRQLPRELDLAHYPFMPYRDKQSVVVDLRKLESFLANGSVVDQGKAEPLSR